MAKNSSLVNLKFQPFLRLEFSLLYVYIIIGYTMYDSIIPQDYYFKKMLKSKTITEYLNNYDATVQQQVIKTSFMFQKCLNKWVSLITIPFVYPFR